MTGPDQDRTRMVAVSVLLAAVLGATVWVGLRTGHVVIDGDGGVPVTAGPTVTPSAPPRSPPVSARATESTPSPHALLPVDPGVADAFAEMAAELGGRYALAWADADGVRLLGSPPGETAWSTIKVPLAVAAAERSPTEETWEHVVAAITRSDNAAALELWSALGRPDAAASAVDEVLDAYGAPEVRTESEDVRPPFSSFGQTRWSPPSQARFARELACAGASTPAGRVRGEMARLVPDQRWGIGVLEGARLKGGWGPEPDGAYVLRQLGDGEVAGQRYALALSVRSASGAYAEATTEATRLVRWWAETVAPTGPGLTCAGA